MICFRTVGPSGDAMSLSMHTQLDQEVPPTRMARIELAVQARDQAGLGYKVSTFGRLTPYLR